MKIQRTTQISACLFFWYLLWQSLFPLSHSLVPVDIFLRLDPIVATLIPLATQSFIPSLLLGLACIVITIFFGRLFCGYICPLGSTLDAAHALLKSRKRPLVSVHTSLKQVKYLFLCILSVTAFFGVNHIFWGSPIALITRFYALLIHPILVLCGNTTLNTLRPSLEAQEILFLAYTQIPLRTYHTVYYIAFFFLALFLLEKITPRFWCRHLCPAGALLALCSWQPLWRRRVHNCTQCGACVQRCPTGAIHPQGTSTAHSECIACRTCVGVCPTKGVSFAFRDTTKEKSLTCSTQNNKTAELPSRRAFLGATITGSSLAALAYINAASFIPHSAKASLAHVGCIRPPGARPEADFLTHCLRCGQCMKVCPTNGLQPSWLVAGVEGIFSPVLMARLGPCEPQCAACGEVCPTEAILHLPLQDKQQAKIGTAVVYPELCLAWAQERSCVVCQEVCPFGAIEIKAHDKSPTPVPVVTENRCFGCGFCEKHCPVHLPAIAIQPLNALHLNDNTYATAAQAAGFDLKTVLQRQKERPTHESTPYDIPSGQLPPGFTE